MIKQLKKYKYLLLLVILMVVGFYLRLLYHYSLGSFWFDEYFGLYFAKLPLLKMLKLLILDTNLPLYNILLWFWIRIFNDSELAVRLLSVIFSIINIPLLYLVGKKLFSAKTAIIGIIFYTFSTYQIYHTTEARSYSLMLFLALGSSWFFWSLIEGKARFYNWLGYFVSTLFLAYTHLTGYFLIFAQITFLIIKFWHEKKKIYQWLVVYLILGGLSLIYIIPFYLNKVSGNFSHYLFYLPYNADFFIYIFSKLFNSSNSFNNFGLFYLLLPLFIFGSFLKITGKNDKYDFAGKFKWSPPVVFCLSVVIIFLIGCFLTHWITPRYFFIASIFVYLLIGEGIVNWLGRFRSAINFLLVLIIFLLTINYSSFFEENNEWKRIDKCLQKMTKAQAKIIVHNFAFEIMLKRYYSGNLPVEGFYPLENNLSYEERIIRDNGRPVVTKENVDKLADATKDYNQILLVEAIYVPVIDPDRKVVRWFLNNSWQMEDQFCQIGRNNVFSIIRMP